MASAHRVLSPQTTLPPHANVCFMESQCVRWCVGTLLGVRGADGKGPWKLPRLTRKKIGMHPACRSLPSQSPSLIFLCLPCMLISCCACSPCWCVCAQVDPGGPRGIGSIGCQCKCCFALLSSHFKVKSAHSLHTRTDKLSRHA